MTFWYFLGAVAAILLVLFLVALAFGKSGGKSADEMTGVEFERYSAELLSANGVQIAEETPATGDFGADFIILLDGERTVLQCKRFSRPVGVKAVQEAIAAMPYYKCTGAAVITNSTFTRQARELAEESGVILWDRADIEDMERCAAGGGKRREYGTVKLCRLESGKYSDETFLLCVSGEQFDIPPHSCTAVTLPCGYAKLVIRSGRKKAVARLTIRNETRTYAVGFVGRKLVIAEIATRKEKI